MGVSTWSGSITATAKETTNKVYGPQNIDDAKLTKNDIPDALVENGDFAEIIQDNYVKRLYNEEKDMNTLMFEKANGERTMYLFKKAVKYEDENGNIVDKELGFKKYDASYKSTLGDAYVCDNGNNDIKIYMPEDISNGVKLVTDDKTIEMRAKGAEVTDKVTVTDDSVVYDEVFGENTSLIYKPLLDGIKEEIVLDEYTGQTEYKFRIKLDGYKLVTLDDNCLYLENIDNGEVEGIIDSVYMIDANGVTDFNNYYTYKRVGKYEYEITAHVNKEFLEAETTVYPVVIDPTITIEKAKNSVGIYDATLNSTSTTEGGSGSLFVGNRSNTENGLSRVAMRFPGLDFDTNKVSVVVNATISLRDLLCESTSMTVNVYNLESGSAGWTEANASWTALGMQASSFTGKTPLDSESVSYSAGIALTEQHTYSFDITSAVQNWRQGGSASTFNRGIVFASANENEVKNKTFGSYNRASYNPVFRMQYLPYAGGYTYDNFLTKRREYTISGSLKGYRPNCLGLALYSSIDVIFDTLGLVTGSSASRTIETVATSIAEYATNNDDLPHIKSATYVQCGLEKDNTLFSLSNKQYVIAVRVGWGKKGSDGNRQWDFHAIAQMSDGRWVDKHGHQQSINNLGYIDPDDDDAICWKSEEYKDQTTENDGEGYCYYSDTAYIVITLY